MIAAGRIDRRKLLLSLTALLVVSNIVAALAANFSTMLVARGLFGAALGAFWTLALTTGGRLVRESAITRATALILTGVTLATILSVPLAALIGGALDWRAAFGISALLGVTTFGAVFALIPPLPSSKALLLQDLLGFLGRRESRTKLAIVALVFGGHFAAYSFITPFLLQQTPMGLTTLTALLLGYGLAGLGGNLAASYFIPKGLQLVAVTLMVGLGANFLLLPLSGGSLFGTAALVLTWGALFGGIPLALSTWIAKLPSSAPEAGPALLITTIQVAIAVGTLVGGVAVNHSGAGIAPTVAAVFVLVAMVVLAALSQKRGTAQSATV
jgi:predicted MFS family arabinose efflux permease